MLAGDMQEIQLMQSLGVRDSSLVLLEETSKLSPDTQVE